MKIKRIDSGVYRFEPDADDIRMWEISPQDLIDRGWPRKLLELVRSYRETESPHGREPVVAAQALQK